MERMLARPVVQGTTLQPISGDISPVVWDSLAEEAHSRGYTFGGAIPEAGRARKALSTGISTVEHLDGYLEEVVSDEVQNRIGQG